ncbi:GRIP and coiled-coil domain-containing protein 2-like isoform X2 [Sycon ciliatum]|uniref:GRIP and coiled-coil domain-containing protein 2-like isoform X2 n=1 Tax=Sycon ciliatum TaxID=27933 RepID=UPI0031F6EA16
MEFLSGIKKAYESIESDINASVRQPDTSTKEDKDAAVAPDGAEKAPSKKQAVAQSADGWDTSWGDEGLASPATPSRAQADATASASSTATQSPRTPQQSPSKASATKLSGKRAGASTRTPKTSGTATPAAATPKPSSTDVTDGSKATAEVDASTLKSQASSSPAAKGSNAATPGKTGGLDAMTRDDLIKHLRKQMALLKASKASCEEMTRKCTHLEQQNTELKSATEVPQKKNADAEDIQAQLSTVSSVRDNLAEQLTTSMAQQDALRQDLKIKAQEIEGLAASKAEAQSQLSSTETERDKLKHAVQQLKKKLSAVSVAKNAAPDKDLEAHTAELERIRAENAVAKQELANVQTELAELRDGMQSKLAECQQLSEKLSSAEQQSAESERSWQSRLDAVHAEHQAALQTAEAQLTSDAEHRIIAVVQETEQLKATHAQQMSQAEAEQGVALQSLAEKHSEELRAKEDLHASQLQEQASQLQGAAGQDLEQLREELASASSHAKQLEAEKVQLQSTKEDLEVEAIRAREEVERLQAEHAVSLKESMSCAQSSQSDALENLRDQLTNQISALTSENEVLKQSKSDLEQLQEERDALKTELTETTARLQAVGEAGAQGDCDAAEKELTDLTMENATLGADLEDALQRNSELQEQLDEANDKLSSQAQRSPMSRSPALVDLSLTVADSGEGQQTDGSSSSTDQLVRIESLQEEVSRLEAQLDEAQAALTGERSQHTVDLGKVSASRDELLTALQDRETAAESATQQLSSLEQQLAEETSKAMTLQDECQLLQEQLTEAHQRPPVVIEDSPEYRELAQQLSETTESLATLQSQVSSLSSEAAQRNDEILRLQADLEIANQATAKASQEMEKVQHEVALKAADSDAAESAQAAALQSQLSEKQAELTKLQERFSKLKGALVKMKDEVAELKETNVALEARASSVDESVAHRHDEEVRRLQAEISAANEESAKLQQQLDSTQQQLDSTQQQLDSTQQLAAEAALKSEDAQVAESAKVEELESQLGDKQAELTKLQERFAKLKGGLVKMKAEVAELKETNAELKTKVSTVDDSAADQLKKSQQDLLETQSSRTNLLLQLEDSEKRQGQSEEKLRLTVLELDSIREQLKTAEQASHQRDAELQEVQQQCDGMQKERGQLKEHIVQLQSSMTSLESMLATERKRVADERALVTGLRQEADSVRSKYEDQSQKRESLAKELEQVRKEASKSNLMNLELDDYERTITSLESRIKELEGKVAEADTLYEKQVTISESFKKDVAAVEGQKVQAEKDKSKIKQLALKTKKELADAQQQISTLEEEHRALRDQLENASQSTESGKVEVSQMATELVTLREQLQVQLEAHRRTEQLLQQRLSSAQAELSSSKNQLATVQADYETYKVRVHSVLKQQKQKPQAPEDSSLKELCDQRADSVQQLNRQLADMTEALSTSSKEREEVEDELQQLNDRYSMLRAEAQQQERDFRDRLEKLQTQHASSELERVETMRQLNSQSEALTAAFKEETARLRDQHASEAKFMSERNQSLQDQLASVIGQLGSAEETVAQLRSKIASEQAQATIGAASGKSQQHRAVVKPLSLQLSGSAASEEVASASSPPAATVASPVVAPSVAASFEKLLNSPLALADDQVSTAGSDASSRGAASLKHQVQHVTDLLNESEANSQLLTQQVAILKEEIRRLERNEARREEVANFEYLKNVVIKFLSSDGKGQKDLIPVLDTLLKLSPQEKLFIEKASSGRAVAQPNLIPDTDGARRAASAAYSNVSSYMRSWTGY